MQPSSASRVPRSASLGNFGNTGADAALLVPFRQRCQEAGGLVARLLESAAGSHDQWWRSSRLGGLTSMTSTTPTTPRLGDAYFRLSCQVWTDMRFA